MLAFTEAQQAPQRGQVGGLVVDEPRVLLEDVVALGPRGVLQLEHRLGVEEMDLALAPPLVLASHFELTVRPFAGAVEVSQPVAGRHLLGQHVEPHPADAAHRPREVLVDHLRSQADGFEDLSPGVGGHRRHTHLRHDLDDALARRLDVVGARLTGRHPFEHVLVGDGVVDGLEGEIGVHRRRAVPDEQGDVMHLAGVARLDHQPDAGPRLLPDQVLVHGRGEQQRGDGRHAGVGVPVRQDDHVGAEGDGDADPLAHVLDGGAQAPRHPPPGRTGRRWRRPGIPVSRRAR